MFTMRVRACPVPASIRQTTTPPTPYPTALVPAAVTTSCVSFVTPRQPSDLVTRTSSLASRTPSLVTSLSLSTQHSALGTRHSALGTRHSALLPPLLVTRHSSLIARHFPLPLVTHISSLVASPLPTPASSPAPSKSPPRASLFAFRHLLPLHSSACNTGARYLPDAPASGHTTTAPTNSAPL